EPDGKVRPESLVELIIQTGRGPAPPTRRRATGTSRRWCGAHTNRVPSGEGDQLKPVAQVQVAGDDGAHRVERRRRAGQHDETGTDPRPIDDPDAHAAVDGGGVLRE